MNIPDSVRPAIRLLYLYYRAHGRWPTADQLRSYGFYHSGRSTPQIDQDLAAGGAGGSIHRIDQVKGRRLAHPRYRPAELRAEELLPAKNTDPNQMRSNAAVEAAYLYRRARGIWPHPDDLRTFVVIHHRHLVSALDDDFPRALAGGHLHLGGEHHAELELVPHPIERSRLSPQPDPRMTPRVVGKSKRKKRRPASIVARASLVSTGDITRRQVQHALRAQHRRIDTLQFKSDPLRTAHRVPYMSQKIPAPAGYLCHYCLRICDPTIGPITRDHIVPQSIGGMWSWWNLVPSCRRCNIEKGDRLHHNHCAYCRRAQDLHGIDI